MTGKRIQPFRNSVKTKMPGLSGARPRAAEKQESEETGQTGGGRRACRPPGQDCVLRAKGSQPSLEQMRGLDSYF